MQCKTAGRRGCYTRDGQPEEIRLEEETDDLLEAAETLAEERGYRHLPEEELMRLAAELVTSRLVV